MKEKQKKGQFADWKLQDWCIYAGFILLCFSFLYGAWHFIKTGRYLHGFLLAICFVPLFLFCLVPVFSKPIPERKNKYTPLRLPLPETKEDFLELAKSIGTSDKNILEEISECLAEPEHFLETIEKTAKEAGGSEAEGLYEDLSAEYEEYKDYAKSANEPFLYGALILLYYRRMIARFDWKADRETFVFLMKKLRVVKANELPVGEDILSESGNVEQFCGQLDKLWEKAGYHTVLIDTDSDEYIIGVQENSGGSKA